MDGTVITQLRRGDTVQVIGGRSRGKSGKILRIDRKHERVIVERINLVKRHMKPTQKNPQGGVVEKEASIHLSKVMPVCTKCARPVRLRHQVDGQGKKQRVCHRCGTVIGNQ
ncbi:MAG: 50S ribosomal protein L24 [Deltaproteobacteria bacterium]|nr:50S ribosomal protein L24 [Deltaproteobacteria bacterium]